MVKAIIVDDEISAQNVIENILKSQFPEISVVGKAGTVKDAIETIEANTPELLFLDIDLPDGKGFDILQQIDFKKYKVIFITAYQEYAIQAIKFSAFDYILKPVNPAELIASVKNVLEEQTTNDYDKKLQAFLSNLNNPAREEKRLALKTLEKIHIVDVKEIIRCQADNVYTTFFTSNSEKIVVSKSIKFYDEILTPYGFMRTHQSHLINLKYISCYNKHDGGMLVMSDGSNVPVSNNKKPLLLEYLESL